MDAISNMNVFVRVVEKESFTAAANLLNCSTSSISKRISQLEHEVGAKLLNRTTHSVLSLTEAGKIYFERASKIIRDIEAAKELVRDTTRSLSGTLRVHMTPGIGQDLVLPVINDFMMQYPDLTVEISLRSEMVDILRTGFDVSIRSGSFGDDEANMASIEAVQISQAKYMIYASPLYLAKHGRPSTPEELTHHNCLISIRQHSPYKWWFWKDHKKVSVDVSGTLVADNLRVIQQAAEAGIGIIRILQIHPVRAHYDKLESLFEELTFPDRVLWAITPRMQPVPRKIATFVDFLKNAFSTGGPHTSL